MLSGGSTASVSLISSLWTVMVQTVPAGRFALGVKVNDVAGDEVCEKLSGVPVGHSIVKALFVALTDSLKFAAGWSGGSPVSLSLMFAATAVTVQLVAPGRSESGLSVIALEPEPLTENVCAPPQLIVNELVVTSTASLKLTVMSVAGSTF